MSSRHTLTVGRGMVVFRREEEAMAELKKKRSWRGSRSVLVFGVARQDEERHGGVIYSREQ